MSNRMVVLLVAMMASASTARAESPVVFVEPDAEATKQVAQRWLDAVRANKTDVLTELAMLEMFPEVKTQYLQLTVPADAKARKRCRKVTTARTEKALKAALPCLLTPDIKAALATANMDSPYAYAVKAKDIMFGSPELTMAWKALPKLDATHVFWSFLDMKVDGVQHTVVLAISGEYSASGQSQVAAVVHWVETP